MLLWSQDKKDGAFLILKKHPANYTAEQYEGICNILRTSEENKNLPLDGNERREYLQQQKEEYLFYQERYYLNEELSKMPINPGERKKPKL